MAIPNKTDAFPKLFAEVESQRRKSSRPKRTAVAAGGEGGGHDRESFVYFDGPGTQEDYDLLDKFEKSIAPELAERVLDWLRSMDGESPYRISRLDHCLQTATRAERDGADDEMVVCALLHDIGDVLAPANHLQVAAALLEPYVSEKNHWIVKHHGVFQGYYYFHYYAGPRHT